MTTLKDFESLPLSGVLELALKDLELVGKDKSYRVNFGAWHTTNERSKLCHVCLAGAVIAKTLKCPPYITTYPSSFTNKAQKRLHALNDVRTGDVIQAINRLHPKFKFGMLVEMEIGTPMGVWDAPKSIVAFKRHLRKVIKVLKKYQV